MSDHKGMGYTRRVHVGEGNGHWKLDRNLPVMVQNIGQVSHNRAACSKTLDLHVNCIQCIIPLIPRCLNKGWRCMGTRWMGGGWGDFLNIGAPSSQSPSFLAAPIPCSPSLLPLAKKTIESGCGWAWPANRKEPPP